MHTREEEGEAHVHIGCGPAQTGRCEEEEVDKGHAARDKRHERGARHDRVLNDRAEGPGQAIERGRLGDQVRQLVSVAPVALLRSDLGELSTW